MRKRAIYSRIMLSLLVRVPVLLTFLHVQSCIGVHKCVCGRVPRVPLGRIAGGTEARRNGYPWQAAFFSRHGNYFCGGTVITERHILTAAHCGKGSDIANWYVILGMHDTATRDGENYSIIAFIHHELYGLGKSAVSNDIALAVTTNHISFNTKVWPICLPQDLNADYVGSRAIIIGWGRLFHKGTSPRMLQVGIVDVITSNECFKTRVGKVLEPDMMICAYAQGVDACQGDSGGPIFVQKPFQMYEQIGVTSFGIGCATKNSAGVYTRVTYFLNWIHNIIENSTSSRLCEPPRIPARLCSKT